MWKEIMFSAKWMGNVFCTDSSKNKSQTKQKHKDEKGERYPRMMRVISVHVNNTYATKALLNAHTLRANQFIIPVKSEFNALSEPE